MVQQLLVGCNVINLANSYEYKGSMQSEPVRSYCAHNMTLYSQSFKKMNKVVPPYFIHFPTVVPPRSRQTDLNALDHSDENIVVTHKSGKVPKP